MSGRPEPRDMDFVRGRFPGLAGPFVHDFCFERLVGSRGIDRKDGVVRVSVVHYTSPAEVDRPIRALDPLI